MLLAKLRIGVSLEDLLTGIRFESSAANANILETLEEAVCANLLLVQALIRSFTTKNHWEHAIGGCLSTKFHGVELGIVYLLCPFR
jgi:hypothetical protein